MGVKRRYKPMPPLTRRAERALRKAITEKWEPAVRNREEWLFSRDDEEPPCACCEEYAYKDFGTRASCNGCPVKERTGLKGCRGTPYRRWADEVSVYGGNQKEMLRAAKAELRFLKDTLRLGLKARERAQQAAKK